MMKCIKYFFLVAVSLTMVTCKKYPEDPFISLHTAKKRLTREWKIQKILVNGNDQTNSYNDSLLNKDFTDLILNIGKDGELREFVGTLTGGDIERYDAFFSFNGKDKRSLTGLIFRQNTASFYYDTLNVKIINRVLGSGPFKILELYRKDFVIQKSTNNNIYEIHFKN